jgi:transposase
MERLDVDLIRDIVYRLRNSQTERAIARDLQLARETVRRYHAIARHNGLLDDRTPLPGGDLLEQLVGPSGVHYSPVSTVEPHRGVVQAMVDDKVETLTIHRRLVQRHGYTGSYSSVRRFVAHLRPAGTHAVVRIEQAQVDFGSVGRMRDPRTGKLRTAYVFVMTLCCSRHQYIEFVFEQSMPTWIACHRHAFESFGGVPKEVVLDNLKAAILKADLEDPALAKPYRRMAQDYGFLIHPCRVRTPQHKGKVENGVHYVKRSFLAGEQFRDIVDANERGRVWVREVAGARMHGTTRQPPLKRFQEEEQAALLPLPANPCDLIQSRRAKVHADCHLVHDGSYYSAPYAFVGKSLDVLVYSGTVQLFDGTSLLFTHPRATQPGQRQTHPGHYPPDKRLYLERTPDFCRTQAAQVGPACLAVVEHLLADRPVDKLRAVQGIVGYIQRVGPARLEAACARALFYGDPQYRRIKSILNAGLDEEPLPSSAPPEPIKPAGSFTFARRADEFVGGLLTQIGSVLR